MKSLAEMIKSVIVDVSSLEALRVEALKKVSKIWRLAILAVLVILPISLSLLFTFGFDYFPIPIVLITIALAGASQLAKDAKKEFKSNFKSQMIEKVVKAFNPALIYHSDRKISKGDFDVSKLFKKDADRILGEDYLEGMHGDTRFRLSELNPQFKVKTKNGTRWVDIFKGLFVVADFHKYFHSETYILPETAWKKIGMNKKKFQGADLIQLENQNFEKKFRVFSTNDTDARYILSPLMMERITELHDKYGDDLHISFRGQNIYIALSTDYDFFEHNINDPVNKETVIKGHLNELESLMAIIDDLNLNTRIWSKIPVKISREYNGRKD